MLPLLVKVIIFAVFAILVNLIGLSAAFAADHFITYRVVQKNFPLFENPRPQCCQEK